MLKGWTISHRGQLGLFGLKTRAVKGRRAVFKLVKGEIQGRHEDAGCSGISKGVQVTVVPR